MYPFGKKSSLVCKVTKILVLALTIFVSGVSVHSFKFYIYIYILLLNYAGVNVILYKVLAVSSSVPLLL